MPTLYQFYKSLLSGFWLLVICLWSASLGAQTQPEPLIQKNWILNSTESTTKNYIAGESIKLQASGTTGFWFKATNDGKTFSAKIDPVLLFPPADKTYAVTATDGSVSYNSTNGAVVGSIPGQFAVSPTGAATYSIPIDVPAGINGMQPNISLVYNSQGGFGAAGVGWDIAGISAITRGGKTIYFDGTNDGIKFNNTDALYLDGQRLIYLSGGNGHLTAGATYGTEVENYSLITYNGSSFILTTVDGKVFEYGSTDESKLINNNYNDNRILAWKLSKMTDTYGNIMTLLYTGTPSTIIPEHTEIYNYDGYDEEVIIPETYVPASKTGQYLKQIDYAGQSIIFNYNTNNSYARKSYINTFLVLLDKILNSITIKSGTTTLKTYGLNYKSSTDNRLSSVTLKASDNSTANSTEINWGTTSEQTQIVYQAAPTDSYLNYMTDGRSSMHYADINGDGHADRIEMWVGGENGWGADENAHIIAYIYDSVHKTYTGSTTASASFGYHDYKKYHPQLTTSDINNDGKAEILFTYFGNLYVYKYNGSSSLQAGFSSNDSYVNLENGILGDFETDSKISLLSFDANKDNFNDVVFVYSDNDEHKSYAVFWGGIAGVSISPTYNSFGYNAFNFFEIGDFNADGQMDVFGSRCCPDVDELDINYNYLRFKTNYNTFIGAEGETRYSADLNSDGLTDMLVQNNDDKTWQIYKNTGNFSFAKSTPSVVANGVSSFFPMIGNGIDGFPHHDKERKQTMFFLDYNGDGLIDIISASHFFYNSYYNGDPVNESHFVVYKNLGDFKFEKENSYGPYCGDLSSINTVSDINGDGIADLIISLNKSYSTTTANNYDFYAITIPNANRKNIVTSITNGMDQTNSVTYKNFSNYDQTTTTYPVQNLKSPMLIVENHTDPEGTVTNYTFEKPKVHTLGKGFLGFTNTTAVNSTKNIKIKSEYEHQTPYYNVSLKKQTVTTENDVAISSTELTNTIKVIDAAKKRYLPTVTQQISIDEIKKTKQTVEINYNQYPSQLVQTTKMGYKANTTIDLTATVTTTFTGPAGVTPYLPGTVTTVRTHGNESETRTSTYAYLYAGTTGSDKYKITKRTETTDPTNTDYAVITEYSNPDSWGHFQTVAVKAKDQNNVTQSRSSGVTYNETGRFIATKTNLLGEITTYDWNEPLGLLRSETITVGGKQRTTSYTYNNWGQLVETKYPDGLRKTNVIQWAGTGDVAGAIYYTYTEASGIAPVKVWYDALGREIQKDTYGLNGNKISVSTEYYNDENTDIESYKGKIYRVSEPYFETDTKTWATTYSYHNNYGYVSSVVTPMGTTTTNHTDLTTTVTTPEGTAIKVTDAAGQVITSSVNEKSVSYTYYPSGLTKTATPQGGQELKMYYNLQGKRTHLIDPDAGLIRNEYNGFGELTKEVQKIKANADSIITTNNYDNLGRLTSINRNGEITTYNFDNNIKDRVNSIVIEGKHQQTFGYDEFGRVESITENIITNGVARTFTKTKEYDVFGRVKKEIYPTGYYTVNTYDKYSNLIETKDGAGRQIWKAVAENARGKRTEIQKGGKATTFDFDSRGLPTAIQSTGIIDLEYQFNSKGNLEYRIEKHATSGGQSVVHREDFKYDILNRLYEWEITQTGATTSAKTSNIVYNPNTGTITSKSDLGGYTFGYGVDNTKPHALTSISGVPASFPQRTDAYPLANLDVTYTDFKKIKTLSEMGKTYELTYGVDDQRRKSVQTINGYTKTRYYVSDYEEEIDALGNVKQIHYLSGAILIRANGVEALYYSYADYQGSLIALTDANGTVVERYAYDPWGARRNPNDWTLADTRTSWIVNRGYTGHEHLDAFGIINMNGRVYDPLTAMFFSPDPYVQAPDNWVNYNRYGYAFGNPFKYTDPSGYWFGLDDLIVAGIGFVAGYLVYGFATGEWGKSAIGAGLATAAGAWIVWNTGGAALAALSSAYSTTAGGVLTTAGLLFTDAGYNLQKLVSPIAIHLNLGIGSDEKKIGWEVSLGVPQILPGYRYNYGESYYWNSYDGISKGKSTIEGGEWSFGLLKLSRNTFTSTDSKGVSTSQSTNRASISLPGIGVSFEDNRIDLCDNLPGISAPIDDDFRSSALEFKFFPFSAGFKIMDGRAMSGLHDGPEGKEMYKNETDIHRFGLGYFGFGPIRIGVNSEKYIRAGIQNWWHKEHDLKFWDELDKQYPNRFHWYFGSTGGSSLW